MNLLATSADYIGFGVKELPSVDLNFIGDIIRWLVEGVGITAIGIILFTLILKTIVLPLDVFSKYKTKKQSLIMERMRPQMEKLQKQYANDKNMYNQKVMELYKKNGYSMLGICLPTIVSLVIFMVVFSQFSVYSQYANIELYRGMSQAYNEVVSVYVDGEDNPEGFLIPEEFGGETYYRVDFGKFEAYYNAHPDGEHTYEQLVEGCVTENDYFIVIEDYMAEEARDAAADYYHENNQGFLWVGNIWYPDSPLNKEVPSFSSFVSSLNRVTDLANYEDSYNEVTAHLQAEKSHVNGYFVLIVLAIGMMFLSQFFSMRMQKSMNELGSVDGSAKRTNKMMLIIMPIIYGLFSFFYSAGFSIYMIVNTLYSFLTTVIVNRVLDVKFRKAEERREQEKYIRRPASNGKNTGRKR